MWSPTHVQVTVQRARGLRSKGKNGTNDAFVTICLGKDKFQTSVKEKAKDVIEWHEKCELLIPKQGNTAEIVLTTLHHNFLGVDDFLGCIRIPLAEMDVYDRPKNKWYKLEGKPGKESDKERGELEVKIGFIVKAGSLSDLSKKDKHKSSLGQLTSVAQSFGGSLISISSLDKRKGIKKIANKIGDKLTKKSPKKKDLSPTINVTGSKQTINDADPGVISEGESDDDFTLDELSQKGSTSSINLNNRTPSYQSAENINVDKTPAPTPPMKPARSVIPSFLEEKAEADKKKLWKFSKDPEMNLPMSSERIIIGKEGTRTSSPVHGLPPEIINRFSSLTREDLIEQVIDLQAKLSKEQKRQRDLEDYLDNLLLRVMETSPRILQNPYT